MGGTGLLCGARAVPKPNTDPDSLMVADNPPQMFLVLICGISEGDKGMIICSFFLCYLSEG